MRRLGLVAALLLLVGVLAACQITITYSPPTSYKTVIAVGSTFTTHPGALDTVSIPSGSTVYYRIDTSGVSGSYPLLYVELSQPINLELEDSGGTPIASAHNQYYFAGGSYGLASLGSTSLSPLDITASLTCNGSCVIVKLNTSSTYFAALTNNTGASATVNLYAYGSQYDDSFEPQNNVQQTSTGASLTTGSGVTHDGALETLNDVDYWYAPATGNWDFSAPSPDITIVACAVDNTGSCVNGPYYDGGTVPVIGGLNVKVYAQNDRAGVASASQYGFSNFH